MFSSEALKAQTGLLYYILSQLSQTLMHKQRIQEFGGPTCFQVASREQTCNSAFNQSLSHEKLAMAHVQSNCKLGTMDSASFSSS